MRISILQPHYPREGTPAAARECICWMSQCLAELAPDSVDLVILPEYANCPGIDNPQSFAQFSAHEGQDFVTRVSAQAHRLHAAIAIGTATDDGGFRNRTILFDRQGKSVGWYDKTHLTDVERKRFGLVPGSKPLVLEWEGLRLGFAVCFDIYFAEYIESLASQQVDLLICPTYQRSESAGRILALSRCRAIDCGAWLLRSSYTVGTPGTAGHSLVAAPDGTILADAGSETAVISASIDAKQRFVKPASHGQPEVEHRGLLERHRRPALYRPRADWHRALNTCAFPRICAHRGLSRTCPENTLAAFAAAIAVGAHEIEFDLWLSRDGVAVVCHDQSVNRTTNGKGNIRELDWNEIRQFEGGVQHADAWRGTRIPRFEEVVDLVDGRIGMNIHIKDPGPDDRLVQVVCDLVREQGLLGIAYVAGAEDILRLAQSYAPDVARACLALQNEPLTQVALARRYGCQRVQFGRAAPKEAIRQAREAELRCNLFFSDDPEEARAYVAMGIDVILTNCAHTLIAAGLPGFAVFPSPHALLYREAW